jgi:hypothetical protein
MRLHIFACMKKTQFLEFACAPFLHFSLVAEVQHCAIPQKTQCQRTLQQCWGVLSTGYALFGFCFKYHIAQTITSDRSDILLSTQHISRAFRHLGI